MTDPDTPEPQSSTSTSAPNREEHCHPIVPSMPVADVEAMDDEQWTAIVLTDLRSRSPEARQALLKVLLNDQSARSTRSSSSIEEGSGNGEPIASDHAEEDDETPASADTSPRANHGDDNDHTDQADRTVAPILPLRSNGGEASAQDGLHGARQARDGAVPLLGLELTSTENTGENRVQHGDSNQQDLGTPLLGTIL